MSPTDNLTNCLFQVFITCDMIYTRISVLIQFTEGNTRPRKFLRGIIVF